MRVLFVQFAAPSFEWEDQRSNVPLAAGNLAAFALPRVPGVQATILDRAVLDRAGDAAAVRILAEAAPDAVAATLYCWSSHRTLDILERLRRRLPGVFVVVGGPEVHAGNSFLRAYARRAFDAAACGEGEELLVELLTRRAAGDALGSVAGLGLAEAPGGWTWAPDRPPVADLTKLPSPYLEGLLPIDPRSTQHFETARGCVFECDFCFYHADFRKVRTFPLERVGGEIRCALDGGANDLYLMDPTFNGHAGYRDTLRALRPQLSNAKASVHTELRAEPIGRDEAALLAASGITSVEVGLQTVTPKALANVGRTLDRVRFARGCRELARAGIDVEIGTIVGLPGDTLGGIRATFEYVRDECGGSALTVPFVLSLLPATVLRERADAFGLRYRPFPPYTLLGSPTFAEEDIRAALALYTEIFDRDLDPVSVLRLVEEGGEESPAPAPHDLFRRVFVPLARANAEDLARAGHAMADRVESVFCAVFREIGNDLSLDKILAFLRPLREANPHGLLEVVLELDSPARAGAFVKDVRAALPPVEGHYLNEHHRHLLPPGADLSLRIAVTLPVRACDPCGRGFAARVPVLWRVDVPSEASLGELLAGPGATGALLIESRTPADLDVVGAAGDDVADIRSRDAAVQRRLDAASGRPPCPPETVVVLGAAAQIVAVRRGL